jgi:predicted metal-binding membrane protein
LPRRRFVTARQSGDQSSSESDNLDLLSLENWEENPLVLAAIAVVAVALAATLICAIRHAVSQCSANGGQPAEDGGLVTDGPIELQGDKA